VDPYPIFFCKKGQFFNPDFPNWPVHHGYKYIHCKNFSFLLKRIVSRDELFFTVFENPHIVTDKKKTRKPANQKSQDFCKNVFDFQKES
jgi:hypothetical protein